MPAIGDVVSIRGCVCLSRVCLSVPINTDVWSKTSLRGRQALDGGQVTVREVYLVGRCRLCLTLYPVKTCVSGGCSGEIDWCNGWRVLSEL